MKINFTITPRAITLTPLGGDPVIIHRELLETLGVDGGIEAIANICLSQDEERLTQLLDAHSALCNTLANMGLDEGESPSTSRFASVTAHKRYADRLSRNPSNRVTKMLTDFIESCPHIRVNEAGMVQAFKGVNDDYTDRWTGRISNKPGEIVSVERNTVVDDPDVPCGPGLHAGSLHYANTYGVRVVMVEIDPADVVSVPKDHNNQKLRCCRYVVIEDVEPARIKQQIDLEPDAGVWAVYDAAEVDQDMDDDYYDDYDGDEYDDEAW